MDTPLLVDLTDEARAELTALLHRTDLSPRCRERLEMVEGADHGFDLDQLCAWSGRSSRTV